MKFRSLLPAPTVITSCFAFHDQLKELSPCEMMRGVWKWSQHGQSDAPTHISQLKNSNFYPGDYIQTVYIFLKDSPRKIKIQVKNFHPHCFLSRSQPLHLFFWGGGGLFWSLIFYIYLPPPPNPPFLPFLPPPPPLIPSSIFPPRQKIR